MKPEDLIELAQECSIPPPPFGELAPLVKFASLIEARLMERLLAGAGEPVYWQCTAHQVAAAVSDEREECAKVCEIEWETYAERVAGEFFAKEIRARGSKT